MKSDPSKEYINLICRLYGDSYDDREEDSAPGGLDWQPGKTAQHKSLGAFRKELEEVHDIRLSTSKILKILITGHCWSTERTREVGVMYETLTTPMADGGEGVDKKEAVRRIAAELEISETMVYMSLPYSRMVYDLEDKTSNAKRCDKWRERQSQTPDQPEALEKRTSAVEDQRILAAADLRDHRNAPDEMLFLWRAVIAFEGTDFITSGRGSRPGIPFTYRVSAPGQAGGRHYGETDVDGYGNEMWICINGQEKGKSISRSTVELGYRKAMELMNTEGCVRGPKALGVPGAGSYLYSIFLRFGVIARESKGAASAEQMVTEDLK